jgi:hypothetical protein
MFPGYDCDGDSLREITLPKDVDLGEVTMTSWTGDPYPERNNVYRGFVMGVGDLESMSTFGPDSFECDSSTAKQVQFIGGDVPPALPLDPDFRLQSTTLIIENALPEQIGNGLLHFLRQKAAASITKVSREKFSVKAYAHVQGLSCDIKVRLYRQKCGFAVEFQRRSGDALAFQRLFRLASEHLNSYSHAAFPEQHAFVDAHRPTVMPLVGQARSFEQEFLLAPLLEMAQCTTDLCLQAEAAEALADYASDANLSWQLSTADALKVREYLARIHHVSVAHPMGRLSAALDNVAQFSFPHFVEAA